jgi:hypothetical protein
VHKLMIAAALIIVLAAPASAMSCLQYGPLKVYGTRNCLAYDDELQFWRFLRMPAIACGPGEYRAESGDCVEDPDSNPAGATALCNDGKFSHSEHPEGACSHHRGVDHPLEGAKAKAAP